MGVRVVDGIEGLAKLFGATATDLPFAVDAAMGVIGKIVELEVKRTYGKRTGKRALAGLSADTTQPERAALGFSPNKPLMRDGSLLSDSVHTKRISTTEVAVGSDNMIHVYHEYGYWSDLYNAPVPARPVFRIAAKNSEVKVGEFAEHTLGLLLGAGNAGISMAVNDVVNIWDKSLDEE